MSLVRYLSQYNSKKRKYKAKGERKGSYLCTLHMLPIRSHILRKLAVTFIAFACRLATKRRLAFSGYPGRIDTLYQ